MYRPSQELTVSRDETITISTMEYKIKKYKNIRSMIYSVITMIRMDDIKSDNLIYLRDVHYNVDKFVGKLESEFFRMNKCQKSGHMIAEGMAESETMEYCMACLYQRKKEVNNAIR